MKSKLIILWLLLISVLMLVGCNFPVSFVMMNQSQEMAEVSYTFKQTPKAEFVCPTKDNFSLTPSVRDKKDLGKKDIEWSTLEADEFICDKDTRTVYVPIAAGIALKIADNEDPGEDVGSRDLKNFPIERLMINGPSGSMEFKDSQVLKSFTRSETAFGTFYIIYK